MLVFWLYDPQRFLRIPKICENTMTDTFQRLERDSLSAETSANTTRVAFPGPGHELRISRRLEFWGNAKFQGLASYPHSWKRCTFLGVPRVKFGAYTQRSPCKVRQSHAPGLDDTQNTLRTPLAAKNHLYFVGYTSCVTRHTHSNSQIARTFMGIMTHTSDLWTPLLFAAALLKRFKYAHAPWELFFGCEWV